MTDTTNLTHDQKEFLEDCLSEFANRFSEEDEDFKRVYDRGITEPPIISPWHGRPRLTAARFLNRNSQNRYNRDRYDRNRQDRNEGRYDNRQNNSRYERNRYDGDRPYRYAPY